jgi:site-specific DNA recombinase
MERYRRGKTHRAQTGSINVLGGAPFGYRYVPKSAHAGAGYEIIEHEAALVAELFRRYADDGASIADLARWLTDQGVPTRTGKHRWDRSVIWGMLRNPAYAGRAVFGKTMVVHESPGLNRVARLQGRSTPRASKTVDRPREQAIEIPVPAVVSAETFARAAQRLADNKRFASRNSKVPSLLQGLAACSSCGYGYYRTSTRTTNKKIYYYRCLGSDDYRYEAGRVCANKPVRADYLDTVVWDHITELLADPQLIRTEIDKRLDTARHSDPAVRERQRLQTALAQASATITRMIQAFGEDLITIDELRGRMPDLRARETNLRNQLQALDNQLADRQAYLKLASDLEGFLAQLHANAEISTVEERQRVLRLLVKDVLVGPEKITIRHRIPIRERVNSDRHDADSANSSDTQGDDPEHCPLRWGRENSTLRGPGVGFLPVSEFAEDPGFQERLHRRADTLVLDPPPQAVHQSRVIDFVEAGFDVAFQNPVVSTGSEEMDLGDRVVCATVGTEPVRARLEVRLEDGFEHQFEARLNDPVRDSGNTELPELPGVPLRYHHLPHFDRSELARLQRDPDVLQESLDPDPGFDLGRCGLVDTCGLGALVGGHAFPRDHQERRVVDEVEQVTKAATRILGRPTVQLGLHPSYREVRRIRIRPLHGADIHRRVFEHCFPSLD